MQIFTYKGDRDTLFSTLDSIRYYGKIMNTGMMTMEPASGKIKVWVGGIDHKFFKYDHVNQAKRQAGSTFKPFAYLTALEQGMSPCDKFTDKPVKIAYQDKGQTKYWEPKKCRLQCFLPRNELKMGHGQICKYHYCTGYRKGRLGQCG